jgi:hypothetical protein
LAKRIGYLALIEFGPVSDLNAVEKHMEVNVLQVALEFAFGKQEWPDLNAIPHRSMISTGRQDEATSSGWHIVFSINQRGPGSILIAYSSALRSSSVEPFPSHAVARLLVELFKADEKRLAFSSAMAIMTS